MIFDAFKTLLVGILQEHATAIVAAIMAVAAALAALLVFRRGVVSVLDFVRGHSDAPKVGHQYEEYDEDGNAHYRTWTKKDQYYYDKARRGRD